MRRGFAKDCAMLMTAAFLASALVQFALGLAMAALLGPAEFGLYAIAFAASVIGQTLVFEWIRLSITRFQGAGMAVAARLHRLLVLLIAGMLLLAAITGILGGERRVLLALAIAAAALWGFGECRGALLRARFDERSYAGLLFLRAALALVLMPLAAWLLPRAESVLLAFMLSVLLALVAHRLAFGPETPTEPGGAVPPLPTLFGYALPIVATNIAYLLLFFGLRLFIAARFGLAEAGSFSLALDLGQKLVMTLGTALDLYLFQLAVRADREAGEVEGRAQIARNAGIVLAVLAPTLAGFCLVLPSIEALLIAPAFRASFRLYMLSLLPGLFLYGVAQYALHPAHQLARRTLPLALAAAAAMATAFGLLAVAEGLPLPLMWAPGVALGLGLVIAALVLWKRLDEPPPVGWAALLARLILALAAMVAAVLPIRLALEPGLIALLASALAGAGAYGALAWITNLAGMRDLHLRASARQVDTGWRKKRMRKQ